MNTTIVRPARIEVDEILRELNTLEPGIALFLTADDAAYTEPQPVWVRPVAEIDNPDDLRAQIGTRNARRRFVQVFEIATGNRVQLADLPAGYWDEHKPLTKWHTLNRVSLLGDDYLLIGMGEWIVNAEISLEGEPAFEFIDVDEAERLEIERLSTYLPHAAAHKPGWAFEPDIHSIEIDDEAGEVHVYYVGEDFVPASCGVEATARLTAFAAMDLDGKLLGTVPPCAHVHMHELDDTRDLSPSDLRAIGEAFTALAAQLEQVTGGLEG